MNNKYDLLRRSDVANLLLTKGLEAPERHTRIYARCVNAVETMPKAKVWINAKRALPGAAIEGQVLAIVNGKWKNTEFRDAYMLAEYVPDEGWIIQGYEEWEDPDVMYWAELPKLPEEES